MSAAPRRAALFAGTLAQEGGYAGRARGSAGVGAPRPSACPRRAPGSPIGPQSANLRGEWITHRTGHGSDAQRHLEAKRASARRHRWTPQPACRVARECRS